MPLNELAAACFAGTVGTVLWSMWKGRQKLAVIQVLLGGACTLAVLALR